MRFSFAQLGLALAVAIQFSSAPAQGSPRVQASPKFTMEWTKAEHAHTINLRDMTPMAPRKERHEAPPLRGFPRTGMAISPVKSPDPALQTIAVTAPSIGNVTNFAGVGNGDYGFVPNAAPPDTTLSLRATQVAQSAHAFFGP